MHLLNFKPRDIIIIIHPNGESEAWFVAELDCKFYLVSVTDGTFHAPLSDMKFNSIAEFQNAVSAYFHGQNTQIIPSGKARITITLK